MSCFQYLSKVLVFALCNLRLQSVGNGKDTIISQRQNAQATRKSNAASMLNVARGPSPNIHNPRICTTILSCVLSRMKISYYRHESLRWSIYHVFLSRETCYASSSVTSHEVQRGSHGCVPFCVLIGGAWVQGPAGAWGRAKTLEEVREFWPP